MKYLIIEDERLAMTELKRMVTRIRPDYECAGWCEVSNPLFLYWTGMSIKPIWCLLIFD